MTPANRLRSIRLPVLGLSAIPMACLLLFVATLWRLDVDTEQSAQWSQHSGDVLEQSHRLQNDLGDAEGDARRYLLTRDPAAYAAFASFAATVPKTASALRWLVRDNPSQETLAVRLANDALAEMREIDAGIRHAGTIGPNGASSQDAFRTHLAAFEDDERLLQNERRLSTRHLWRVSALVLIAGTILTVVVTLAVNFVFGRRIVTRLRRLAEQTAAFTDGQTVMEPLDGHDEIAGVSRVIRDMAAQIKQRDNALIRYACSPNTRTTASCSFAAAIRGS
jgi:CHASE3 domain sensor protein